jgi:glycosyltransferase involved in cell wall biosynthesis
MKIGWITPLNRRCGIAFYAKKYASAISNYVEIVQADPEEFKENKKEFLKKISSCDVAHIQYEPSFFLQRKRDFYPDICRAIGCKRIVTLHEVYRKIPGVFPREEVSGPWPVKAVKELLWDMRHPHWASFTKHCRAGFWADAIVAHTLVQRDILAEKGCDASKIHVVPLPVEERKNAANDSRGKGTVITLGATGFINPTYDYDFLFSVLERCGFNWRFVWIGGPRRDEEAGLLQRLENEIRQRQWQDRVTITGWVSDEERDGLLDQTDVYCAFFKDRSSSESLATAMGMGKMIVASEIPLTRELAGQEPVMALCQSDPEKAAQQIQTLVSDGQTRQAMRLALARYCEKNNFDAAGRRVVDIYKRTAGQ